MILQYILAFALPLILFFAWSIPIKVYPAKKKTNKNRIQDSSGGKHKRYKYIHPPFEQVQNVQI